MKNCTKTDYRMYQPLIGLAEEICWTCGAAKDKHSSPPAYNIEDMSAACGGVDFVPKLKTPLKGPPPMNPVLVALMSRDFVLESVHEACDRESRMHGGSHPNYARLSPGDYMTLTKQLYISGTAPADASIDVSINTRYGRLVVMPNVSVCDGWLKWVL